MPVGFRFGNIAGKNKPITIVIMNYDIMTITLDNPRIYPYIKISIDFGRPIEYTNELVSIVMKTRPKTFQFLSLKFILSFLCLASLAANIYFYFTLNSKGVGFGDGWSRLNISRRVVDSLTPGIAQIGGVWLPFPQILISPFSAVDALYYRGIAAAFVSSPAFILGGYFLYRILRTISKSRGVATTGAVLYATNTNLLYLQTTAMSEPLFLCALLGCVYYFFKYVKKEGNPVQTLVLSGFWAFVASFTRYEGFLLVMMLVFFVFIASWVKTKRYRSAEGTTLIVGTVAMLGIIIWNVYSWAIFGDPLNWAKIYSGKKAVVSTVIAVPSDFYGVAQDKGKILIVFKNLYLSIFQMSNFLLIPITAFSAAGLLIFFIVNKKRKKHLSVLIILLLLFSPSLFMILSGVEGGSLMRGPDINFGVLFNTAYFTLSEYNIRYGILTFPFLIVLSGFVFSRTNFLKGAFIGVTFLISLSGFIPEPNLNYSFPRHYEEVAKTADTSFYTWFNQNYDGGLVLVSVIANDPVVYNLKIPYKNYIYEGTGQYWKKAIKEPSRLARWVLMKSGNKVTSVSGSSDLISFYLAGTDEIVRYYDIAYQDKDLTLYKVKWDSLVQNEK